MLKNSAKDFKRDLLKKALKYCNPWPVSHPQGALWMLDR